MGVKPSPVLTEEQWTQLREAFARGKEAERQFASGEPVTVNLSSFIRAGDDMRLSKAEKRTLNELRAIRNALADASEETRALLVEQCQSPSHWLNRVEESISLFETASDFSLIGEEMVAAGKLSREQASKKDFSPAGHPHPYGRYEAVAFLVAVWTQHSAVRPEAKVPRGGYLNQSDTSGNYYRFNDFVKFIGRHLLEVDPSLETGHVVPRQEGDEASKRTGLEAACYHVWVILGELYE